MKRSIEAQVVVAVLLAVVAAAVLGWGAIARAEPVQQLSFEVSGASASQLTLHVHLRRFDTTGAVPPTPTALDLRFPAGVRLDPAFLTARYRCDGAALRDALDARPNGVPFDERLAHLGAFARELADSRSKRDRAALANVRTCERARLGSVTGLVDARDAIRVLTDPIPFRASMFLSRATIPGAVTGLQAIGAADPRSAIVRRYPVVAGVHALEQENLVSDPSPDGLYDLELHIDTGPINGFQLSRARIDATVRALRLPRGTCLERGRGGRCVRRQRADVSLFDLPRCPASGLFNVQLFAAYPPPTPAATTTQQVPCPRFSLR